ncbi:hypothetical protein [Geminicoccus roseus]|uniref:hypothetical protein n=1 Tax=Geminicoccus roseus TaxID=404900 RepID=UPI0012FC4475|nr:hypothetical protein [Geminicoccus roseus]
MADDSNRLSDATIKAYFNRAARVQEYSSDKSLSDRTIRAQVDQRAHAIHQKADEHYNRHKNLWVTREYNKLVRDDEKINHNIKPPAGFADDKINRLMKSAELKVELRKKARDLTIDRSRRNLIGQLQKNYQSAKSL